MKRKLTLSISDYIYKALYDQIGKGEIAKFIENLVAQNLDLKHHLEEGYLEMAKDTNREKEAMEWIESNVGECLPTDEEDWSGWDA